MGLSEAFLGLSSSKPTSRYKFDEFFQSDCELIFWSEVHLEEGFHDNDPLFVGDLPTHFPREEVA
jgi:hypothetical protein